MHHTTGRMQHKMRHATCTIIRCCVAHRFDRRAAVNNGLTEYCDRAALHCRVATASAQAPVDVPTANPTASPTESARGSVSLPAEKPEQEWSPAAGISTRGCDAAAALSGSLRAYRCAEPLPQRTRRPSGQAAVTAAPDRRSQRVQRVRTSALDRAMLPGAVSPAAAATAPTAQLHD